MADFERSLYVACALNGSTEGFREEVEETKRILEHEYGMNILHFRGLGDFTDTDVYEYDMHVVNNCSAFLGIYGFMSDGRGMETKTAIDRGIPMLGVAHQDDSVSKMVTGGFKHAEQPFVRYSDMVSEVPKLVVRQFVEINNVL